MGIFLITLLISGGFKESPQRKFNPPSIIGESEFKEIKDFKFKPFKVDTSRNYLKTTGYEKIYKDFFLGTLFSLEFGEIKYDPKKNKFMIPSADYNSYCEIAFWKEISPEIENTREKIREISKRKDAFSPENQIEIMKIKENFHKNFLKKRIEVMEKLENTELLNETQKAYKKYKEYYERRDEK